MNQSTPHPPIHLEDVTRVSVVGPDGIVYEDYCIYPAGGAQILIQDEGRTLKILAADPEAARETRRPQR